MPFIVADLFGPEQILLVAFIAMLIFGRRIINFFDHHDDDGPKSSPPGQYPKAVGALAISDRILGRGKRASKNFDDSMEK